MRKIFLHALTLAVLVALPAAAAEKPLVKVGFTLAEPVYRNELTAPQIQALATRVTAFLAGELSREVRFLRFVDASDAPFRLAVRLGMPGASTVSFHDVLFHVELTGPDGIRSGATWPFRDGNAWGTGVGSPLQLEAEIEVSLGGHDMAELVPQVFSAIPVATDGLLAKIPEVGVGWVLPFRQEEICMETKSEVRLTTRTRVPSLLAPVPGDFRATALMPYRPRQRVAREELRDRLFCKGIRDQEGFDMMERSAPADVQVVQVFVLDYRRIKECGEPLFGGPP